MALNQQVTPSQHCSPLAINITMDSFLLPQVVPHPTYATPAGRPTLIDLIFLSAPHNLYSCSVVPSLASSDLNRIIPNLLPPQEKSGYIAKQTLIMLPSC